MKSKKKTLPKVKKLRTNATKSSSSRSTVAPSAQTPPTVSKSIRVAIIESERGWGRKLEDVKTFPTMEAAQAFIKEYNAYNTATTAPDWYMQAELMDEVNYG